MRYLLAIVLPPVAMFTVGKPFQAILCLLLMLTVLGWPIAAIWAILVVNSAFADTRAKKSIKASEKALDEAHKTREAVEAQTAAMAQQEPPAIPAP